GGVTDSLALNNVMRKRLTITGSTLRPQSSAAKSVIIQDMQSHIWGWLETGKVKPIIQEVFALKDAAKAHTALEAGQHIGKFVLYVSDV
ncbi:MAG: NAD(P)H-quinone oxidoreductase, partial [Proteobacteria bacterium]|nr:NAD(P)H-quinone oxidoreductase [Pseudomonadota bacterium]